MFPQYILIIEATLLGLVLGSFLNVCIHRLPLGLALGGRSTCPQCRKKIPWYDNFPVFSFILLGGKCRSCKTKISFQYPLVELLTAGASVLTLYYTSFDIILYFIWFLLFVCPMIVLSVIDIYHRIIPDVISLPGIPIGLLVILYIKWPFWSEALIFSGIGLLAGGGTLLLLAQMYYWIRKREGMGGGDIKLAAMLGAFLGWQGIIFVFMISSVLALLYALVSLIFSSNREESLIIPYGPFLAAAGLIYLYFGQDILNFYFNLIGLPSPLS